MLAPARLDLDALDLAGEIVLDALDESFVGTESYLGLAHWWAADYHRAMPARRRRAHQTLLDAGLPVRGASVEHDIVLSRVLGTPVEHEPELSSMQGATVLRAKWAVTASAAARFRARMNRHTASWIARSTAKAVAEGATISEMRGP